MVENNLYYYGYSKDLTPQQIQNSWAREHYYIRDMNTGSQKRMFDDQTEKIIGSCFHKGLSPDKKTIIIGTNRYRDDHLTENCLYLYNIESGKIEILVDQKRMITYPEFSPDSQCIAYYSSDPMIMIWQNDTNVRHKGCNLSMVNVKTKEIQELAPESYQMFQNTPPSWSPDGSHILLLARYDEDKKTELFKLDIKTKKRTKIIPGDGTFYFKSMAWMADERILFSSRGSVSVPQTGIYQMDPEGGNVKFLFPTPIIVDPILGDLDKKKFIFHTPDKVGDKNRIRVIDLNGNDITENMKSSGRLVKDTYWRY
jgi:Tol biopolymer transport system component